MPTLENFDAELPLRVASDLPLKVKPFPMIDILGAELEGNALARQKVQTDSAVADRRDEDTLKQYINSGGYLDTPDGAKQAVADLKGQVSAKMYKSLINGVSQAQTREIAIRKALADRPEQESKQLDKTLNYVDRMMRGAVDAFESASEGPGGTDAALSAFNKERDSQINEMERSGVVPKEMLAAYRTMEPARMKGALNSSQYHRGLVKEDLANKLSQSRTESFEALAGEREAAGEAKTLGDTNAVAIARLQKIAENADGKFSADQVSMAKEELQARLTRMKSGGKTLVDAVPADPDAVRYFTRRDQAGDQSWRSGLARSAEGRSIIVAVDKNLAKEFYSNDGPTPEETAAAKEIRGATGAALKDRTKFIAASNQFIRNFQSQADLVEKYLQPGVGGSIPVLNRWIQAGRKAVAGDVDVTNLDTVIRGLSREHQRIVTGVTSNGQLLASAQVMADELLNRDMTAEQIRGVLKVMREEAVNANVAGKTEIQDLEKKLTHLGVAGRDKTTTPEDFPRVSKEQQAKADETRANSLAGEVENLTKIIKDPRTSNRARKEAQDNLMAVQRELGAMSKRTPATHADTPALSADNADRPTPKGLAPGWSVTVKEGT